MALATTWRVMALAALGLTGTACGLLLGGFELETSKGGSGGSGGTGLGGNLNVSSSSGQTSASSSSGTTLAACDAPPAPPSNGSCYKPPQPTCPHPGMDGGTAPDGGLVDCATILPPDTASACGQCAVVACCSEFAACAAIPNCIACVIGTIADPVLCLDAAVVAAREVLTDCAEGCCTGCVTSHCNPVNNEGCDTSAGEACDVASSGFVCIPGPADAMLCETCSNTEGPLCAGTLHCTEDAATGDTACARYCCDDGDCGTGKCDKTVLALWTTDVGLCMPK